ncbi:hypothetical protein H0X10_03090 [Candidatus Saccharibacteria bacterium]|nr:hypothetical protein [Candidatus Saccharibacteria bacterium]
MIATNHALMGALLGLSIGSPIALPIALMSHFVLDSIPHYSDRRVKLQSQRFFVQLTLEAILCAILVLFLALQRPEYWLLAAVCAFLAVSPDFMWIPRFVRAFTHKPAPKTNNFIIRFHKGIQWFERPIGIVVEIAWLLGATTILANIV